MHTCTYIDICTLLKRSLKFLPTTVHSDPLLTQTAQLIPGSRGKGDTTWGALAEKPTEGSSSREEENQLNLTAHSAFLTGPYLPPPHFQCKLGAAGRPNEYLEELRESQKRSIRTDELEEPGLPCWQEGREETWHWKVQGTVKKQELPALNISYLGNLCSVRNQTPAFCLRDTNMKPSEPGT